MDKPVPGTKWRVVSPKTDELIVFEENMSSKDCEFLSLPISSLRDYVRKHINLMQNTFNPELREVSLGDKAFLIAVVLDNNSERCVVSDLESCDSILSLKNKNEKVDESIKQGDLVAIYAPTIVFNFTDKYSEYEANLKLQNMAQLSSKIGIDIRPIMGNGSKTEQNSGYFKVLSESAQNIVRLGRCAGLGYCSAVLSEREGYAKCKRLIFAKNGTNCPYHIAIMSKNAINNCASSLTNEGRAAMRVLASKTNQSSDITSNFLINNNNNISKKLSTDGMHTTTAKEFTASDRSNSTSNVECLQKQNIEKIRILKNLIKSDSTTTESTTTTNSPINNKKKPSITVGKDALTKNSENKNAQIIAKAVNTASLAKLQSVSSAFKSTLNFLKVKELESICSKAKNHHQPTGLLSNNNETAKSEELSEEKREPQAADNNEDQIFFNDGLMRELYTEAATTTEAKEADAREAYEEKMQKIREAKRRQTYFKKTAYHCLDCNKISEEYSFICERNTHKQVKVVAKCRFYCCSCGDGKVYPTINVYGPDMRCPICDMKNWIKCNALGEFLYDPKTYKPLQISKEISKDLKEKIDNIDRQKINEIKNK